MPTMMLSETCTVLFIAGVYLLYSGEDPRELAELAAVLLCASLFSSCVLWCMLLVAHLRTRDRDGYTLDDIGIIFRSRAFEWDLWWGEIGEVEIAPAPLGIDGYFVKLTTREGVRRLIPYGVATEEVVQIIKDRVPQDVRVTYPAGRGLRFLQRVRPWHLGILAGLGFVAISVVASG